MNKPTGDDKAFLWGYSKKTVIIVAVVIIILIVIILFWMCSGGGKKTTQPHHNGNGEKKKKTKSGNDQSIQNIKVEPATNGQTKVSWDPVEGDFSHYVMYYSEREDFSKDTCNSHNPIGEPSILLASDVPRQYYFRVAAVRNIEGQEVEGPLSELGSMFLNVAQP